MKLGRNAMVALAMLLGSDYTEGVKGVGIVNAMEILDTFDVSQDLKYGLGSFRHWLDGFDPAAALGVKSTEHSKRTKENLFHSKHRTARTRWVAPENFPADNVMKAYFDPVVDKSSERFSWGGECPCRVCFN
jgi:DNA excision repair protein ERCC-5